MKLLKLFMLAFLTTVLVSNAIAQTENSVKIQSELLDVLVDSEFPRIIKYTWKSSGAIMYGQSELLSVVTINGEKHSPQVSSLVHDDKIEYTLNLENLDVLINIDIRVIDDVVELKFTNIVEKSKFKIHSIEIPNHNLLSIRSNEKDASFSGSKMYTAVEGNGDTFQALNKKTFVDTSVQGYLYAITNNEKLAGAIWSNAVEEKTDNNRIKKLTSIKKSYKQTAIWSGSWIYRADRMNTPCPLPKVKIIISGDRNNNGIVDWQDGAIAYRKILNTPLGSGEVPNLVVQRIPMNFSSQATNPFTKSLDETKRIFLNTDGLGQYVILKGYGSEGHDSKHPDYGDIGRRQGGAEEMNILCDAAPNYNAFIGVHINGTESYPEADAFDEILINRKRRGWNWLDQSYYMDKRYDAASGNRLRRLQSLKNQVPGLDFIYVDVWYAKGSWDSRELGREIHSLDLAMTTEFPQDHEYDAIWNHWAVDYNYGGKKIKGYHSDIVRFIRNHQKDTWIAKHPILGGAEMVDYEGWQGRINYDACIDITFDINLPTKYLQSFPIIKWQDKTITFEGNVKASVSSGNRIITKNGKVVCQKGTYLLPWNPKTEEKLYHWNNKGGETTWNLPNSWKEVNSAFLYQLTDVGRVFVKQLEVANRSIKLTAKASTPYVIYKTENTLNQEMNWGEGSLVKDPGFNNGDLKHWNVSGDTASVKRNSNGQYELVIGKGNGTVVSQTIDNLTKGHYFASVYVATKNKRKASFGVIVDGKDISNYTNSSLWENYIAADSKHGSKMQRMYVQFDVKHYHESVKFYLKAEKGNSVVLFDDVRIKPISYVKTPDSLYFKETFEHVPSGIFPFVKGSAGGSTDPRVHLSELHSPYTQKGWNGKLVDDVINGKWSLKIHEYVKGLIIQTIPQNLRFEPGKNYTVSFSYQTESSDYSFVIGDGTKNLMSSHINPQFDTHEYSVTFTASDSGDSWIGISKNNKNESDFILDDLIVIENED